MNVSYRQQVTFMGMLIGAALGAIGAMVWMDHLAGEELPKTKATTVGFGDMARLATATIALVRQVNEMTRVKDEPVE